MGAPIGNQNARKAKEFESAIRRSLARKYGSVEAGLDVIAGCVVAAATGDEEAKKYDAFAARDIADRLDGKPKQAVDVGVTEDEENPLHKFVSTAAELASKLKGK